MRQTDKRIPVYYKNTIEDRIARDQITVAAKSLGMTTSGFFRAAALYALEDVVSFDRFARKAR